jgi:hypothetical protein
MAGYAGGHIPVENEPKRTSLDRISKPHDINDPAVKDGGVEVMWILLS